MATSSPAMAFEKRVAGYVTRISAKDHFFAHAYAELALSRHVTPAQIVSTTQDLTKAYAACVATRARREPERFIGHFRHFTTDLQKIATHPALLNKAPAGFSLVIADRMAGCLVQDNVRDMDAQFIHAHAKSIIFYNAVSGTRRDQIAASVATLATASRHRPVQCLDTARFAVSGGLGLASSGHMSRVIETFARHADPVAIAGPADTSVRALQILAEHREEYAGCDEDKLPILRQALANFDDILAGTGYRPCDAKTAQRRQGLVAGREAIVTLAGLQ